MNKKIWKHVSGIVVVFGACLYLAQNCGMEPVGELSSLENFAAGKRVLSNTCAAPPNSQARRLVAATLGKMIVQERDNFQPVFMAARNAITAIPDTYLDYFLQHNGSIIITKDTAELCAAAIPSGSKQLTFEKGSLASCFVHLPATARTRPVTNFIVSNNPGEIQHSIVRLFGSMVTQLAAEGNPAIKNTVNRVQNDLSEAFIRDVMNLKSFDLADLKYFLGQYDQSKLQQARVKTEVFTYNPDRSDQRYPEYFALKQRFFDYVYAESFDSFYCNNWGPFDQRQATLVRDGKAPLETLSESVNTRERMRVLFPQTFKVFQNSADSVLAALRQNRRPVSYVQGGFGSDGGFNLQGRRGQRSSTKKSVRQGSPFVAGTKAFFGSLWGNTGGAVGSAHQRYSARVEKSMNNYYRSGGRNVAGAIASGIGGGVSDSYKEEVYNPVAQQTEQRFQTQIKGGMTADQAATNAVLLALGDHTGATPFLEGAYGVDTTDARFLGTGERLQRGVQGATQLADLSIGVGGLAASGRNFATRQINRAGQFNSPSLANRFKRRVGAIKNTPDVENVIRDAVSKNKARGVATDDYFAKFYKDKDGNPTVNRYQSNAEGHAGDARLVELKPGDKLYALKDSKDVFTESEIVWFSRKPPPIDILDSHRAYRGYVGDTALPKGLDPTAMNQARVVEIEITKPVTAVDSTVAPNWGGLGGSEQTFLPINKGKGDQIYRVTGDTANSSKPVQIYDRFQSADQGPLRAQQRGRNTFLGATAFAAGYEGATFSNPSH